MSGNYASKKIQAEDRSGRCKVIEIDPASGSYWFYPDDRIFEALSTGCWMDIVCITIARWARQPQGNFYAGGLVLTKSTMYGIDLQGNRVDIYNRVGYFEHFWRSKHTHWVEDGDIKGVVLI